MIDSFDPTAIPLLATLAFAVAMYPLGFFMTAAGCTCCRPAGCVQCGRIGYAANTQRRWGAMCCDTTQVLPTEITVRVAVVGSTTFTLVTDSDGAGQDGIPFTRKTRTYNCSVVAGDYVLGLQKFETTSALPPSEPAQLGVIKEFQINPFIGYSPAQTVCRWISSSMVIDALSLFGPLGDYRDNGRCWMINTSLPYAFTVRTRTCVTTYDFISGATTACNVGTVQSYSGSSGAYFDADLMAQTPHPVDEQTASGQRCSPRGDVYVTYSEAPQNPRLWAPTSRTSTDSSTIFDTYYTGCQYSVTVV